MFNFYPYTDFHELNADWILAELKRISEALNELYESAVHDAVEQSNAYTDEQIGALRSEFEQLSRDFDDVESRMDTIEGQFATLVNTINGQIAHISSYIDAQIVAVNARTDAAIEANNNHILAELTPFLAHIQVQNFFTGEYIGVQEMFDFLCSLHLTDAIDYDTMAARSKTYTELAAFNIDYVDLVAHGNTLYV